ncbi:MFS transporter [Bdellovibrio sp. BCCA]|uniref:MFS transporter n=1 Tax=Bdellovibrio sp. BCCA TaxID=3136281 RepID=UPI0030F32750
MKQNLTSFVLWVMTVATGLCVANLYYCQPLLHQIQNTFGASAAVMGWIPTGTQLGYALGMFFLSPLGDRFERRRLIFISTLVSAVCLIGVALSPNIYFVIVLSLLLGLATMTPQYIIPFAAHLSSPQKRGQTVGMVMSGMLLGILLARTVSGFIGDLFGWRVMFGSASVVLVILAFVLRGALPQSEPSFSGSYVGLLKSVIQLVKELPVLRESMVFGSMMFGAFSAFWATLIYLMESPAFNLGAKTVGLFGILGASGALAAPLVGRLADRRSPRQTVGYGIAMMGISFLIYLFWGGTSLIALSIGVVIMDVGLQVAHVSNQSRVFSLIPEARSRLNTAYMFFYFIGGAAGSLLASIAWSQAQWTGVCIVALIFVLIAGTTYFFKKPAKSAAAVSS